MMGFRSRCGMTISNWKGETGRGWPRPAARGSSGDVHRFAALIATEHEIRGLLRLCRGSHGQTGIALEDVDPVREIGGGVLQRRGLDSDRAGEKGGAHFGDELLSAVLMRAEHRGVGDPLAREAGGVAGAVPLMPN